MQRVVGENFTVEFAEHSNSVDSRMTVASGQAQAQFPDFSSQLTLSMLVVVFRWLLG